MKTITQTTLIVFACAMLLTFQSCKKEVTTPAKTTDTKNQLLIEQTINDVHTITFDALTSGTLSFKNDNYSSLLGCASVIYDTTSKPCTRTIDYGSGCTTSDGHIRKGKVVIAYDKDYRKPGSTITVSFINYFVDDNQMTGSINIINNGYNGNGNLYYSMAVSGQVILAKNAGTIDCTGNFTCEWIAGELTDSRGDDVYSFTGVLSVSNQNGDFMNRTITSPLIKTLAPSCTTHFIKGVELIQKSGEADKTIDYGNGTCDDIATETQNGVTTTIHL
jgi:hypothetical protein